ncbi:phosphocholine-specific phospholipase C [Spirillospora sp. NPDC049652]
MSTLDRRRFMQLMGAGTAAAGLTAFPPAVTKALAMPALGRTGTIKDVEHVVILMQENRSFDHYFGTMRGVRGFSDPRPHLLPNGNPVWRQPAAKVHSGSYHSRGLADSAVEVLPWYVDPQEHTEAIPGTNHGWSSGHLAWNGGRYDEWVNQKQDVLTMGYVRRQDIQYHWALAEAFTTCDAYFCSVHADTAPNRIYLWTGTIDAQNRLGAKPNGPGLWERNGTNGYTWTTYPERLEKAGVSWKLYQGGTGIPGDATDNYTDNSLEFFRNYQRQEGASGPLPDKGASTHTLIEFADDVKNGRLPQVTWIVPPSMYSEHPSSTSTNGAYYINKVLEALTSNPEVWGRTVFLINYDENDGLFDHVVPPMPPSASAPDSGGVLSRSLTAHLDDEFIDLDKYPGEMSPLVPGADPGGRQPIGLGPRVPMLVVSPWSRGGWVCSETFDHTSVLRFLEKRFGIQEPNISPWRRAVCGDLTSAFDFSKGVDPRPVTFPVPPPRASRGKPYQVSTPQTMPTQERGVRPARPLPYDLLVNEVAGKDGRFTLEFDNRGKAGAAFYVYDRLAPTSAPRRYAVSARDAISDHWTIGRAYHLAYYGPNGSLCEFAGEATTHLTAEFSHDRHGRVMVRLRNTGRTPVEVTAANAYDRARGTQRHTLRPHATHVFHWKVSDAQGWYDVSLKSGAFLRRYAGHLENGRPTTSDPGPSHL